MCVEGCFSDCVGTTVISHDLCTGDDMSINIIGVYSTEATTEPCYLIEAIIEDFQGDLDLAEFTQEVPRQPRENWQVPWDEHILDEEGITGELAPFPGPLKVFGSQRIAFFFHYLDLSRPLITPIGKVYLPEATKLPDRLSFIGYEPPG